MASGPEGDARLARRNSRRRRSVGVKVVPPDPQLRKKFIFYNIPQFADKLPTDDATPGEEHDYNDNLLVTLRSLADLTPPEQELMYSHYHTRNFDFMHTDELGVLCRDLVETRLNRCATRLLERAKANKEELGFTELEKRIEELKPQILPPPLTPDEPPITAMRSALIAATKGIDEPSGGALQINKYDLLETWCVTMTVLFAATKGEGGKTAERSRSRSNACTVL